MYYVFNFYKRNVVTYNEFWEYQREQTQSDFSIFGPLYSIYANDQIYTTGNGVINKYDKYLNLTTKSNESGFYSGIYFNSSNGLIYSAEKLYKKILTFNQNLILVDKFNLTYMPMFITEYKGMMIITEISKSSGNIYFYQNNVLIKNITTNCGQTVNSILFDNFNHMIVLCDVNLYIYHTNGTYTGIGFINFCTIQSNYISFDSKNRLVVLCSDGINLYY